MHEFVKGVKEESLQAFGDIPLEEHWLTLVEDEAVLCQPFTKTQAGLADLRKSMIEWIFNLGDKLRQRSLTLQLAIVYIDKLFLLERQTEIQNDKYLWGLTALYLASKYDELDENIPFIKDFRKASSKGNYSWTQVTQCESLLAHYLNWDLMIVSPLNYTYALLTFGVVFTDDKFKYKLSQIEHMSERRSEVSHSKDIISEIIDNKVKSVRKYCEFYTDMSLQSFD